MLTLVHATLFLSFDEPYHGNTKPNYIAYPTGGQAMARRLRLVPGLGARDRRQHCSVHLTFTRVAAEVRKEPEVTRSASRAVACQGSAMLTLVHAT
jgi:hypothetical protein